MIFKLSVPRVGELEEIRVLAWKKAEGAAIKSGDLLVELEMDKAIVEVTAAQEGVLRRILFPNGQWYAFEAPLAVFSSTADEPLPENIAEQAALLATFEAV